MGGRPGPQLVFGRVGKATQRVVYFIIPSHLEKAFPFGRQTGAVYVLLIHSDLVVFCSVPMQVHFMPKLHHYVSYAALAAALIMGFAVTMMAGSLF